MKNEGPGAGVKIKFRLRRSIIFLVVGALFASSALMALLSYNNGYKAREQIAQDDMRRVATLIAAMHTLYEKPDWKRTDDYAKMILRLYAAGGGPEHLELLYVFVLDPKGRTCASAVNFALARKHSIDLSGPTGEPLDSRQLAYATATRQWDKKPIPNVNKVIMPMNINGRNYGTVKVGYYVRQFALLERRTFLANAVLLVFLSLTGTIVAIVITRRVVNPILAVVKAMKRLSAGDLEYRLKTEGADEAGFLASGFNEMAESLRSAQANLEKRENELAISERKYRVLFHSAGESILLLDKEGRCLDANAEAERMLGWNFGMLKGARLTDLVMPDCGEKDLDALPANWKGRVVVPGGTGKEVEVKLAKLDDGCRIAVIRDITHWIEAEDKINRIKMRQQRLIESLPVGVFTADHNLIITGTNKCMEQMIEIERSDILGEPVSLIAARLEKCDLERAMNDALDRNREVNIRDIKSKVKSSAFRVFDFRILRFTGEPGMPPSLLVVANDITDRFESERMRREFEARIARSHENGKERHGRESAKELSEDSNIAERSILVVSDNKDFLNIISDMLSLEGFAPAVALGGNNAVSLFENYSNEFAAVIIDEAMTDMKAADVFLAFKEIKQDIRTILCSENPMNAEIKAAMSLGIQRFVQLPVAPAEFGKAVLETLGG